MSGLILLRRDAEASILQQFDAFGLQRYIQHVILGPMPPEDWQGLVLLRDQVLQQVPVEHDTAEHDDAGQFLRKRQGRQNRHRAPLRETANHYSLWRYALFDQLADGLVNATAGCQPLLHGAAVAGWRVRARERQLLHVEPARASVAALAADRLNGCPWQHESACAQSFGDRKLLLQAVRPSFLGVSKPVHPDQTTRWLALGQHK
mmetsp:Transcript_14725/g.19829  ORF Transcript_14725/g.19829 Transcript_14725/m.19829 type:complete len:205 (+) Transcript_14725:176-790(+)